MLEKFGVSVLFFRFFLKDGWFCGSASGGRSSVTRIARKDKSLGYVLLKFFFFGVVLLYPFQGLPVWASETEILMERGKNLYDVRDYRGALNLFDRVLDGEPQNGPALDYSGWCLRYLGDFAEAERRFEKALAVLHGKDAEWVYIGLGELFLEAGHPQKALSAFSEAGKAAAGDEEASLRALKGEIIAATVLGTEEASLLFEMLLRMDISEAETLSQDLARMPRFRENTSKGANEEVALTNVVDRQKLLLAPESDDVNLPPKVSPQGEKETEETNAPVVPEKSSKEPSAGSQEKRTPPKVTPSKAPSPLPSPSSTPMPVQLPLRIVDVWGVPLGESLDIVIPLLSRQGIEVERRQDVAERGMEYCELGKAFSALDLPSSFSQNVLVGRNTLSVYRGRVMKVSALRHFPCSGSPAKHMEDLERAVLQYAEAHGAASPYTCRGITAVEYNAVLARELGLWMMVRNGMDRTCSVHVEWIYLPLFSDFLDAYGKSP